MLSRLPQPPDDEDQFGDARITEPDDVDVYFVEAAGVWPDNVENPTNNPYTGALKSEGGNGVKNGDTEQFCFVVSNDYSQFVFERLHPELPLSTAVVKEARDEVAVLKLHHSTPLK